MIYPMMRVVTVAVAMLGVSACGGQGGSSGVVESVPEIAITTPEQTPSAEPSSPASSQAATQEEDPLPAETEEESPRSAVPSALVGSWDGGSQGATAGRSYSFSSQGYVRFRRGSVEIEGTVVVEGDRMTMYFPGQTPWEYAWSIDAFEVSGYEFSNLLLDGYSYVRQD